MPMGLFDKISSEARKPVEAPDPDATFNKLVWLEPEETGFKVRVLDCRPVAQSFMSASENSQSARFFGSNVARVGAQFRGQHPEDFIRVSCDVAYPLTESLPDGPVFLASVMEEKWNI